jgi:chromosome segregation ATPase
MEETKTRPGSPGDRAQIAAEKLRALRERANQEMNEHRGRLSQIESELSSRVRQLAAEFEHTAASGQAATGPDEVAALREQLEEDRARHAKFVEQLAAARRQLDAIQSQPCAACADAAQQLADAQGEIGRLREQLQTAEQQQEVDAARHEKFAEQVAAARQAIADLQAASHEQSAQLQAELDATRAAKTAADEQVASLARDLELLHAECDALQSRADKLEQERTASLDDQRRAADAEAGALRDEIATLKADAETSQRAYDSLTGRTTALEADLAAAHQQRDAGARDVEDAQRQISELEAKLAGLSATTSDAQKAQAEKLAAAESRISELQQQLSAAESARSQTDASLTDAQRQRQTAEESLAAAHSEIEQLQEANTELVALKAALEKSQSDAAKSQQARDEVKSSLEQAQAELAQLRDEFCPKTERDDLQQKLELALADVQKLKGESCPQAERDELQQEVDLALADVQKLKKENGALREELTSRPAASSEPSPELDALRGECETLTARVQELEQTAAATAGNDASQDTDDLHRRFEMALDDVRQLKQENALLREQLEKGRALGAPAGGSHAGGGNDWAAQKARLLAMLAEEEGEGPIDAERRKQRATIEDTIERTDATIAEKERELAELRAAQVSHVEGPSCNLDRQREEILSADEQVAAERERLAKLQAEWEQKLRAHELEFSVERAKLARDQAALKERMFELQKLEAQGAGLAAEGGDMKPRRRWLDALGLGDEGKDGKAK